MKSSVQPIGLYALYNPAKDRFVGHSFSARTRGIVYADVLFGAALKFETYAQAKSNLEYVTRKDAKSFSDFAGFKGLRIAKVHERVINFSLIKRKKKNGS